MDEEEQLPEKVVGTVTLPNAGTVIMLALLVGIAAGLGMTIGITIGTVGARLITRR